MYDSAFMEERQSRKGNKKDKWVQERIRVEKLKSLVMNNSFKKCMCVLTGNSAEVLGGITDKARRNNC